MPTWEEKIKRPRLVTGAILRVSGIPYLFGTIADPSWTVDGETYGWSRTLARDSISLAVEEADPWTGRSITGQGSASLVLDALTVSLFQPAFAAAIKTTVTAEVSPSATTIPVASTAAFPSSAVVRINTETISYAGKTSTSFTGCTRGLYGSTALRHLAGFDAAAELGAGGPLVSSLALSWVGRFVDLWLVPLRRFDGADVPFATAIDGQENARFERGIVTEIAPDWAAGVVTISWQSVAAVLDQECGSRLPRGELGVPSGFFQLDVDSNRFQWAIEKDDEPRASFDRVIEDPATGEPLAVGLYSASAIAAALAYTVERAGLPITADVSGHAIELDGKIRLSLIASGDGSVYNIRFVTWAGRDSILPELGFTEDPAGVDEDGDDGAGVYYRATMFTADSSPPSWRVTEAGCRRLYYRKQPGPAFDASPGWLDVDGEEVNGAALFGEELVDFDAAAEQTVGPLGVTYLQIARRGRYGSTAAAAQGSRDEDPTELRQVLAFPSTPWPTALRYLAESDGVALAWRGAGASIDPDLFDDDSFELAAADPRTLRDVVVTEASTIIDAIAPCLVQSGYFVRSGQTIELVKMAEPRTGDAAVAIVQGDLALERSPSWNQPEENIVNVIAVEDLKRNEATGEGLATQITQGTSIGTWGRKDTLTLSMRHCAPSEARAIMREAAIEVFGRFASPYAVAEGALLRREHAWTLRPGDVIELSHGCLPNGTNGRGLEGRQAVVWRVARRIRHSGAPADLTAIVHHLRGEVRYTWAPSAWCASRAGASLTLSAHAYSLDLEEADAAAFLPGWPVRLYDPADESTAETNTIASITGNTMVLTSSPTIAAPFAIELGDLEDDIVGPAFFGEEVNLG